MIRIQVTVLPFAEEMKIALFYAFSVKAVLERL